MSLRMFHLVFISLSVILAAFFAAWAGGQYRLEHEPVYAVTTLGSLAAGGGLAWYGAAFQRKTRNL
jgi:hypothetical protein